MFPRPLTALVAAVVSVAVLAAASSAAPVPAGALPDPDADGDGLTDFDEVHKYLTDPAKADTDGDGKPDGDWDERREFTYSIRCLVSHLPPAQAITDGWQDARELHRDEGAVELEIVAYPLATPDAQIHDDAKWRDAAAPLAEWTKPNLTCDFDDAMRKELVAAMKESGIDAETFGDKMLVGLTTQWALARVETAKTGFAVCFVTAKDGKLALAPGTDDAFAREAKPRTFDQEMDHEARGRAMFRSKRCGACTSTAIYLQTILRALGVPTRTTVAMPPGDASDRNQAEMLREGLRPSGVRDQIVRGAAEGAGAWTAHTFNDVFVGGRWRRLNESKLGQPIVDPSTLGLMLRVLDYDDRATSGTAETWGRRHALQQRSARFPGPNPYRLLSVSDELGPHSKVRLPAAAPDHAQLTVTAAHWSEQKVKGGRLLELRCAEWFDSQDGDQYRRFTEGADREFTLHADGHPDVSVTCALGSIVGQGYHAVAVFVSEQDLAQMAAGVDYRVVARNAAAAPAAGIARTWKVADGVVIRK